MNFFDIQDKIMLHDLYQHIYFEGEKRKSLPPAKFEQRTDCKLAGCIFIVLEGFIKHHLWLPKVIFRTAWQEKS